MIGYDNPSWTCTMQNCPGHGGQNVEPCLQTVIDAGNVHQVAGWCPFAGLNHGRARKEWHSANTVRLQELQEKGFRMVVWNQRKWQYTRSGDVTWQQYVEVVDDLGEFLDYPIKGKPLK